MTGRRLARLPLFPRFRLHPWLRLLARRIGFTRCGGRLRMPLMGDVGIIGVCAGGGFGSTALLTARGRSRKAAGLARTHLPACSAAMSATAAAASSAAAPLAALSTLASVSAFACNLTLLSASFDAPS